ncbi:type III polyketide synthase [Hazenella coriacea]|uniref:15-methylpalmitoyl-4-hydroxy-2-pyrone synthase n=1 Tax=Hazenella coriacea TaxID=1179467 RepID=A0A4R3LB14_9BACL|nr:3-oxoacyl-[acyl-carrier-protein] synthase III C-terminal domain-containing protein [Hazenella coriacea]TCS96949.1 15-methylpalmitoyl-4-hydroxy-2-pyrone synthase [Hazenella coriacea]
MSRVISVGTAVPQYVIAQDEARQFAKQIFEGSFSNIDRLLTIFENTAIHKRRFSQPISWFEQERTLSERNQAYMETACQLGEEAIQQCLDAAGIAPQEIDHIIFVSTTGIATPSIDAYLINQLEMNSHIKRTPIWGLGCAGGVAGLSRAYEFTKAFPDSKVLLLAVECCGLTFRRNDSSKSNLVATSLFADGAAAVLVVGDEVDLSQSVNAPRIVQSMSTIWSDSLGVMGWEVMDDGLKVLFSKDIPTIVRSHVKPVVDQLLTNRQLHIEEIEHFITHPGGMKVIQAYQEALQVPMEKFTHAHSVLNEYGNMSSATVLFVLKRELEQGHRAGSYGLMNALGPGFSSEMILLKWEKETPPLTQSFSNDQTEPELSGVQEGV